MLAIKDTIGNTEVLIQTTDIEIVGEKVGKYGTTTTSIKPEDIENVYARAKSVIMAIAEDIGSEIDEISKKTRKPNELELQFNLGFSAKANAWFLSAEGDCALTVKMSWDLGKAQK